MVDYPNSSGIDHNNSAPPLPSVPYEALSQSENPVTDKFETVTSGIGLGYYPASSAIMIVWILYIAGMVYLLEKTADMAGSTTQTPWRYNVLPGFLLTIFAQAHVPITTMHLSRLAVSALHSRRTSPRSWIELFWMTDKSWQGPIGMLTMMVACIRMRARVSVTILAFALICLIALATPVIIVRAFPTTTVIVNQEVTVGLNTTSPSRMPVVDSYSQISAGSGTWNSGRSVISMFNSSTFVPMGGGRSDPVEDQFFAGDVERLDVTLPGLRFQSNCSVLQDDVHLSQNDSWNNWVSTCLSRKFIPPAGSYSSPVSIQVPSVAAAFGSCTASDNWDRWQSGNSTSASLSALAWINSNWTSPTDQSVPMIPIQGVIECESTLYMGHAFLNGTTGEFSAFQEELLYSSNQTDGANEPQVNPLWGALYTLSVAIQVDGDDNGHISTNSWLLRMGYSITSDDSTEIYNQPNLDAIASSIANGANHMAYSIILLSTDSAELYTALQHSTTAARVRDAHFATAAYALLGGWLFLLLIVTAIMFRQTFGDSLNSYVTARLLADNTQLVDGHCCGSLEDNPMLTTSFKFVGDARYLEQVGHISAGGQGSLSSSRKYGMKQM